MKYKMTSLQHNGIYVAPIEHHGFYIIFNGIPRSLTPKAEQMSIAWCRRLMSETLSKPDELMIKNFMEDLCNELHLSKKSPEASFGSIQTWLTKEQTIKEDFSKEEKKKISLERKAKREALKEFYGYATVDRKRLEISNWAAEPSCLFVGRGDHPMRGQFKSGPQKNDIILNLSPDANVPEGYWETMNQETLIRKVLPLCKCRSRSICPLNILNSVRKETKNVGKELNQILNFITNILRKEEKNIKILEMIHNDLLIPESLKENGMKEIQKKLENIDENTKQNIIKLMQEMLSLKDTEPYLNLVASVKNVKSPTLEFLNFIMMELKEKKEMIGGMKNSDLSSMFCVLITIELSTHLKFFLNSPWKDVIWENDKLYLAKWVDKLSGKVKYVLFSDSAFLKQDREKAKFKKAELLGKNIQAVEKHIQTNLNAKDLKRRKIATVSYLILAANMRVGDEKDPDEADTVGAITLRPQHLTILGNEILFDFLGKDSVRWEKKIIASQQIINNLQDFATHCKDCLFEGIMSSDVKDFLSEALPGLSAKTFRTWKCTDRVRAYLDQCGVKKTDADELKKYHAKKANLEAAKIANHKRKVPDNFDQKLNERDMKVKEENKRLRELIKQGKASDSAIRKARKALMEVDLAKEARDYNLNTSLKNYIDPSVYVQWAKKIDFSLEKLYSKTLQKKYSWLFEEPRDPCECQRCHQDYSACSCDDKDE